MERLAREVAKPTLCLDFDGVLHAYRKGWTGCDVIDDEPVPGAQEFCRKALELFEVVIFSTRCAEARGVVAIHQWLERHDFPKGLRVCEPGDPKPAAFLSIDDRALTFTGEWWEPADLLGFRPWNK